MVCVSKLMQIKQRTWKYIRVARVSHTDFAEHLANHYFYVLITDFNPLHPVYTLNFTQKIILHTLYTLNTQEVFWINRTFCQFLTGNYFITNSHFHTGVHWNGVAALFYLSLNRHFLAVFALFDFFYCSMNLSNNSLPFRITGLE